MRLGSDCAVTRGKTGSGEIAWNSEPKNSRVDFSMMENQLFNLLN